MSNKNYLYFDSSCLFCQFWVKFFIAIDRQQEFYFVAIQSKFAKDRLPASTKNLDTIIFESNGHFFSKSTAILRALLKANPIFYPFAIFLLIPRQIRNVFYDIIAHNRYKWFGKSDVCDMPSLIDKDRFIL